jgi:biopolymer transport protein TolR
MTLTPLRKRAARKARNKTGLDMNLVALIDIFTIMIFFLLSSASGIEILTSPKAVALPASTADRLPRQTLVVVVTAQEILVDGRRVAGIDEAMRSQGDVIAPLKAELDHLAAARAPVRAENQAAVAAKGHAITIMGDKAIPYSLLRKVMATAARANYSDVSFAVVEKVKVAS